MERAVGKPYNLRRREREEMLYVLGIYCKEESKSVVATTTRFVEVEICCNADGCIKIEVDSKRCLYNIMCCNSMYGEVGRMKVCGISGGRKSVTCMNWDMS